MAKILIVDDNQLMCEMLSEMVKDIGHEPKACQNLKESLNIAAAQYFDIVFLDVEMPDGNGLKVLPKIKKTPSSPEIIIITGVGDADGAELAINNGAWDYIEKASSNRDIRLSLERALKFRDQKSPRSSTVALKRDGIIGNSHKMNACLDRLAQTSQSNANVLITGETGTGKELFARAVHRNSDRSSHDFVVVDCAALPDSLVESILFGHERGAFTGAHHAKEGLVSHANKGTLFLDEVGELPLALQKSFLRVLQEHRFRPLGGRREIKSDFRLVAATHRNLKEMVQNGRFRKDLYFRIQTTTINLPPLRERSEDIAEIVRSQVARICSFSGLEAKGISEDFIKTLSLYHWPGNVRELFNTLERAIAGAFGEAILFDTHLPKHIRIQAARRKISKKHPIDSGQILEQEVDKSIPKMKNFLNSMKSNYLSRLMCRAEGQIKKACEMSGLSRAHLYKLLNEYNIDLR
jgi:two-component system, NtrC family, response regulator